MEPMTTSQAAKQLNISPGYLRQIVAASGIEASHHTRGGHRRFSAADIEQLRLYLSTGYAPPAPTKVRPNTPPPAPLQMSSTEASTKIPVDVITTSEFNQIRHRFQAVSDDWKQLHTRATRAVSESFREIAVPENIVRPVWEEMLHTILQPDTEDDRVSSWNAVGLWALPQRAKIEQYLRPAAESFFKATQAQWLLSAKYLARQTKVYADLIALCDEYELQLTPIKRVFAYRSARMRAPFHDPLARVFLAKNTSHALASTTAVATSQLVLHYLDFSRNDQERQWIGAAATGAIHDAVPSDLRIKLLGQDGPTRVSLIREWFSQQDDGMPHEIHDSIAALDEKARRAAAKRFEKWQRLDVIQHARGLAHMHIHGRLLSSGRTVDYPADVSLDFDEPLDAAYKGWFTQRVRELENEQVELRRPLLNEDKRLQPLLDHLQCVPDEFREQWEDAAALWSQYFEQVALIGLEGKTDEDDPWRHDKLFCAIADRPGRLLSSYDDYCPRGHLHSIPTLRDPVDVIGQLDVDPQDLAEWVSSLTIENVRCGINLHKREMQQWLADQGICVASGPNTRRFDQASRQLEQLLERDIVGHQEIEPLLTIMHSAVNEFTKNLDSLENHLAAQAA